MSFLFESRHSATTHILESGAGIRQIQVYLGHADISSTMVYTHVINPELESVYEKSHLAANSPGSGKGWSVSLGDLGSEI